ncbi:MAG: tetratricopeptide repeat protein [Bacteroidetes bacterium]|nr:tetratricopeptide repeat protein [Bacteroidota bacterium]
MVAEANFWSGEAHYKLNKYDEAVHSYNNFILTPAALKNERYNLANYNIGYSYFKQEEYSNALSAFRKYVKEKSLTDPTRFNDATLRVADCYFMLKDQSAALENYNAAIAANSKSTGLRNFPKGWIANVFKINFQKRLRRQSCSTNIRSRFTTMTPCTKQDRQVWISIKTSRRCRISIVSSVSIRQVII